jgi:hypothetical protein
LDVAHTVLIPANADFPEQQGPEQAAEQPKVPD